MTRSTFIAGSMCVLMGAASAAQTPAQPGARQPSRTETAQTLTLTGCLKPWDPSTMQVGSSTAAGAGAQQFVLTDAEYAAPATTVAAAPSGAQPPSGSSPVAGAHDTYLLKTGASAVDFAGHINQKVQVMGTLVVEAPPTTGTSGRMEPGAAGTVGTSATTASPTGASTTGAGTTSTGTTDAAAMSQKAGAAAAKTSFTVQSITMVEKTCK